MRMILAGLALGLPLTLQAATDVQGLVNEAPTFAGEDWKVGGEVIHVTDETKVKPRYGRLHVGSCVSFTEDGDKSKLKTLPMKDCDKTDYDAYFEGYREIAERSAAEEAAASQ